MKKQLMRIVNTTVFNKFFKTAAVVLMLTGAAAEIQASPVFAPIHNSGAGVGKTVINYLSTNEQNTIFEVKVENTAGEKFTIIIKDDHNNTLYRGNFSEKDFSKKFLLPKVGSDKITFHVKSNSGYTTESFEINSNTRVVEEVIVKRV
jgi:hypothetical protein